MRVLLEENLPRALAAELIGHRVSTVQAEGWPSTKPVELLRLAHERLDALLTMDRGLHRQQNLSGFGVRIVVICTYSNRIAHLRPLVGSILKSLDPLSPGQIREVGG